MSEGDKIAALETELKKVREQLDNVSKAPNPLEEELKKVKEQLDKVSKTPKIESKTVYISKDKKLQKFSGRPVKESDPSVEEWLQDMQYHLKNISGLEAQIEFLYDHLQGQARDEIRTRAESERNTPAKIIEILQQLFQDADTIAQIQQQFFQRDQKKGESLQQYSLVLMKLVDRMLLKKRDVIGDKEVMLKERFIDGVIDYQLRREMRRFSLDHPGVSFPAFRQEVLRWAEDHKSVSSEAQFCAEIDSQSKKVTENKSDNDELLKILASQQQILESQQKQLTILTELMKQNESKERAYSGNGRGQFPSRRPGFRGRFPQRGVGRGRGQPRTLTCYNCQGEGHIARNCPNQQPTQENVQTGNLNL